MKISANNIFSFINNIPNNIRAILLYGADVGLGSERVSYIVNSYLGSNKNDDNVVQIFYSDFTNNVSILEEEVGGLSLFSTGRKVIILREFKDIVTKHIKSYIEKNVEDVLVLIQSENLSSSSPLRKLCETSTNCAAIPCYLDDLSTLKKLIVDSLNKHNLSLETNVLEYLANNLGNNRLITNSELNKIILYKNGEHSLSLEEAESLVVGNSVSAIDKIHFSLFNLRISEAYTHLLKILEEENPIFVIRAMANHTQRIHYGKALIDSGLSIEQVLSRLKPPIFYLYVHSFKQQLNIWNLNSLKKLEKVLIDAEIDAKLNTSVGVSLVKQIVLNIKEVSSLPTSM